MFPGVDRLPAMADDITQSLDLVLRAQGGDQASLNRLCERYYDRVRRIVRLRLGSRLRESVDSGDILQETFLAAVRSIENFEMREEASLINWLSRLAERQIITAS
jgi:DNA-directed RNA polymerase specialized sigma24 family protein